MPNLLFPQTFTDLLALYKGYGRFPTPSSEDKLESLAFVPDDVRGELTPHRRPFISRTADVPDPSDIPPGSYYWKANHGWNLSKRVDFPADEETLEAMRAIADEWLTSPSNEQVGQWWSSYVPRQVYLEADLGAGHREVDDWKFWVFGGRVEIVQVDRQRRENHRQNVYDRNFAHLDQSLYFEMGEAIAKPNGFERMITIAEAIGRTWEFVRVDLYLVDGRIYLGELTLVPNAAGMRIRSPELDLRLGAAWPDWGLMRRDLDMVITD